MADRPQPARFPLLLSAFCGLLALILFFSGTVPAAAEQRDLQRRIEQRSQMLELLQRSQQQLAGTEASLDVDPQTLLVEIDKLGMTPEELVERYGADQETGQ